MVVVGGHVADRSSVDSSAESKITTGIPLATAASTGSTSACASSGASTIPSTPAAIAFWTSWICWTRSSSFCGPCQITSTFPSSSAALSVPAWSVFQNSCVVPLGITITRHFFDLAPERLDPLVFSTCGG